MSEPFLGELKLVPYNFAPRGWAACNGQVLSISQNTALFSLLGTTYGGNGETTFCLPDLRSRVPIHYGQGPGLSPYSLGQAGGEESVTLTTQEMPEHNHLVQASNTFGNNVSPNGAVAARAHKTLRYAPSPDGNTFMNESMITPVGQSLPHDNIQPYLVLQWIIALEGIFPSRN
jgi:microcystin-dependent protein